MTSTCGGKTHEDASTPACEPPPYIELTVVIAHLKILFDRCYVSKWISIFVGHNVYILFFFIKGISFQCIKDTMYANTRTLHNKMHTAKELEKRERTSAAHRRKINQQKRL